MDIQKAISLIIGANVAPAAKEMSAFKRLVNSCRPPVLSLDAAFRHMGAGVKDGTLDINLGNIAMMKGALNAQKYTEKIIGVANAYDKLQQSQSSWSRGMANMGSQFAPKNDAWTKGLGIISGENALKAENLRNHLATLWQQGMANMGSQFAPKRDTWAAGLANIAGDNAAKAQQQADLRASGVQYLQQFETHQQRVNRQIQEARKYFKDGAISAGEYQTALKGIRNQNSALVQGFQQFKGAFLTLVGPLVLLSKTWETFKHGLHIAAELDLTRARLEVLSGSAAAASSQINSIRALSASAGINFGAGSKAASTMMGFGIDPSMVSDYSKVIAEITAGDSQRFENMTLAFSQMHAAGKLMGQELLQLVNAGFNPLQAMSEATGVSMADLRQQMSDGALSAEEITKWFIRATEAGGRFHGMSDAIGETLAGQMSKASSQWEILLGTAADNDIFKRGFADLSTLLAGINQFTREAPTSKLGELEQQLADINVQLNYAKNGGMTGLDPWHEYVKSKQKDIEVTKGFLEEAIKLQKDLEADTPENRKKSAEARALADEQKISKAFEDLITDSREGRIKSQYGDFDELIKSVRESSLVSGKRKEVDEAIAMKKTYREIIELLSEQEQAKARIAQIELETTQLMDAQAKIEEEKLKAKEKIEEKFQDERKELLWQIAHLETVKAIGEDQARVWQIAREMGVNQERAEELRDYERQLTIIEQIKKLEDERKESRADRFKDFQGDRDSLLKEYTNLQNVLTLGEDQARAMELIAQFKNPDRGRDVKELEDAVKGKKAELELREYAKDIANPEGDLVKKLAKLNILKDRGQITSDQFNDERKRLLGGSNANLQATPLALQGSQEAANLLTSQTLAKQNVQTDALLNIAKAAKLDAQVQKEQKEILSSIDKRLDWEIQN